MYDAYARELIASIPHLPGIDRDACRRALSTAYLYSVNIKFSNQNVVEFADFEEIKSILRALADSLESIAVFDPLNNVKRTSTEETSSAFVAAEALSLLSNFTRKSNDQDISEVLLLEENYLIIEAALLYMIGGYDINAASLVRNIQMPASQLLTIENDFRFSSHNNALYVLERIVLLCQGHVIQRNSNTQLITSPNHALSPVDYDDIIERMRGLFYREIGKALDNYLDWLGGYNLDGYQESVESLRKLRNAFDKKIEHNIFSNIYHLVCMLSAAIERTKERALLYNVPRPIDGDVSIIQEYLDYLHFRARGTETKKGFPFLWPSTLAYVNECLVGPHKDAVIAMPTGSGKSFLAELAVSQALCLGWVLYLAPTNALAHQISRDLKYALQPFSQVTVRSFVGAEEYTTLSEDMISSDEKRFVAVMTPEKCALAMRLYPESFKTCTLCVFDECHLINDENRGVISDILLAQLCFMAPDIRFLLMSAMLSNADELAEWLRVAHKSTSIAPKLKWRPSRTLRGLLALDKKSIDKNYPIAKDKLSQLGEHRKNVEFSAKLALLVGLSGRWTKDGPSDYRAISLPVFFPMDAARQKGNNDWHYKMSYESWKNTAARMQSEFLAKHGIPTICFILTSRHHAFSSADKVTEKISGAIKDNEKFPEIVEAWLSISDAELGVETFLRNLLRKGIAVHTSAMLQTEQAASEWMFSQQKAGLMFATPTLAQGLNLPAIGVVVAGTKMGDPRDIDKVDGVSRVNALILNGFGRAGRPGFANQGIAILVGDNPIIEQISTDLFPTDALVIYPVLGESDASVEVVSPIVTFLEHTLENAESNITTVAQSELILTTLLAEQDEEENIVSKILSSTLAAHQNRQKISPNSFINIQKQIFKIKEVFLERSDAPKWITKAAMKSGVSFFHAWRMWSAYQHIGVISIYEETEFTLENWIDTFFEVMAQLPPTDVKQYFAPDEQKTRNVLTDLRDLAAKSQEVISIPWERPMGWNSAWLTLKDLVFMYMQGNTYADIAKKFLGLSSSEEINNKRSGGAQPIPAVFGFLSKVVGNLAIDAGCFLAIHELSINGEDRDLPASLQGLPLCIRNGLNSVGALSWYRFGYRERVCAHAFQRLFPVPADLKNDAERATWVKQQRKEWLQGNIHSDEPVLEYAKTVIKEGSEL